MCGKDLNAAGVGVTNVGSPPHVRERRSSFENCASTARITPACAGKTQVESCRKKKAWDHPCMCGKDLLKLPMIGGLIGSPPHVRERPAEYEYKVRTDRITPACAGKTS